MLASDAVVLCTVVGVGAGTGLAGSFLVAAILGLLGARGRYRVGPSPSLTREGAEVATLASLPVVALALAQPDGTTGMAILRAGVVATAALLVARGALYGIVRRLRADRVFVEPTLVVGAGQTAVAVARALLEHPEYGMRPVGFVDDKGRADLPLPLLGGVRSLEELVRQHAVRRVVIAFGAVADSDLVEVVRACDSTKVQVHVVPRLFELGWAAAGADEVWGFPLVPVGRALDRPLARRVKRGFDLVVGGAALVLAAPAMAVIAMLVRLSSPGPVLFRQRRVGEGGRVVEILKFRSMRVNDDSDRQWSVAGDGRVTPIGRLLRRTSLDELPQLINVLRGDMSLVGPRPERSFFVERFRQEVARYDDRHRAPVGLTGWAQVHGLRGDTPIEDRARFDNHYIENWSLWRDVTTLVRTVVEVVRGGERRAPVATAEPQAVATAPDVVGVCTPQPAAGP